MVCVSWFLLCLSFVVLSVCAVVFWLFGCMSLLCLFVIRSHCLCVVCSVHVLLSKHCAPRLKMFYSSTKSNVVAMCEKFNLQITKAVCSCLLCLLVFC